jgi:branched-chain amino acid transport system permease protein
VLGALMLVGPWAAAQSSSNSTSSDSTSSGSTSSDSTSSDSTSSGSTSSGSSGDIHGVLTDKHGTSDVKDDTPITGVRISVTKDDGTTVGEDITDSKGAFSIELPGEGKYTTTVDTETLPKGVKVANSPLDSFLTPGQSRRLNFEVNAAARATTGTFDQFLQSLVDGTNFGLIIAMCAVGLSLIYGTTGLVNFAHGELVTLGAIVAFYFNRTVGWPLLLAAPIAIVVCGGFGWTLEAGFWGPLRRKGIGNISLMVVSIGLALAANSLFLYTFGGITQPYTDYHAQRAWEIGSVDLAPKKFASTVISLVVLLIVAVALQRTRTGKAMRAISDNPDLAASSGINVDSVIRMVWGFGAGLAALGGILFSISQDVNFDQGSSLLLLLFAAVTLGGLGAAYGALVGGFVIGLFVNVSTVWIPTELKNVGALGVLIIVLLVRPQGILGRAERIG